jgi:DNA invertase Pin-like site-specific DNA recombinase
MQRPAAIDDQFRSCSEFAESRGWEILPDHIYKDVAVSGARNANRIGLHALEAAAANRLRPFDCVLIEHMSRLGCSHADVFNFVKLMRHHGIRVCFADLKLDSSEEHFTAILSFSRMFDQRYVEQLSAKVSRAQKERVLRGFHVGKVPYGHRTVAVHDTGAPAVAGRASSLGSKLEVIHEQAMLVRRIFRQFADGHSVGAIRRELNAEKIPSPRNVRAGRPNVDWTNAAIRQILRNPTFRGEIVWNTSSWRRQPMTGTSKREMKPVPEHVLVAADHLRLVDDDHWVEGSREADAAQA